jgi:hypothetical protein
MCTRGTHAALKSLSLFGFLVATDEPRDIFGGFSGRVSDDRLVLGNCRDCGSTLAIDIGPKHRDGSPCYAEDAAECPCNTCCGEWRDAMSDGGPNTYDCLDCEDRRELAAVS